MDLARAIHTRWAADGDLVALLPIARVMTGTYVQVGEENSHGEPDFPYAVIRTTGDQPVAQANNDMAVDEVTLEIIVSDDDYDDLLAIVHRVKQAFNRADFDITDSCKVINIERQWDYPIQDEETLVWDWIIIFAVRVYLPAGV